MSARAEIRAVTFDVGGTLMKPWPSVGHIYSEVTARHGAKAAPSLLDERFTKAWRARKHFNHTREEWEALIIEVFGGLLPAPPGETFLAETYDYFREPAAWRIFDDVAPALDELASRDINLGIISNWDERLIPLLDKMGLSKYFAAIIVSCDVGFPKPSPVIFEQASRKLGEAPQFILHVGDSHEHDVAGAQAAGYQSLLIERGPDDAVAGRIRSLVQLREF